MRRGQALAEQGQLEGKQVDPGPKTKLPLPHPPGPPEAIGEDSPASWGLREEGLASTQGRPAPSPAFVLAEGTVPVFLVTLNCPSEAGSHLGRDGSSDFTDTWLPCPSAWTLTSLPALVLLQGGR